MFSPGRWPRLRGAAAVIFVFAAACSAGGEAAICPDETLRLSLSCADPGLGSVAADLTLTKSTGESRSELVTFACSSGLVIDVALTDYRAGDTVVVAIAGAAISPDSVDVTLAPGCTMTELALRPGGVGGDAGVGGMGGSLDGMAGIGGGMASDGGGGAGGSLPISEVAIAGARCNEAGRTACLGSAQEARLSCDGTQWVAASACPAGKLCDSRTGRCADVVAACEPLNPDALFCSADELLQCGPDLVSVIAKQSCEGLCVANACQAPVCGDGKVNNMEACDDMNDATGDGCNQCDKVQNIVVGDYTTFARLASGRVKGWGYNAYGGLGLGDANNRGHDPNELGAALMPINLGSGRTVGMIAGGRLRTCALLDNGQIKCFGSIGGGQVLGDEVGEMGDALPAIVLPQKALRVATGEGHNCAIIEDGTVYCWGSNRHRQLGTAGSPTGPVAVSLPGKAVEIVAGASFSCALLDNGTVYCWGITGEYSTYGLYGGGLVGACCNYPEPTKIDMPPQSNFNSTPQKAASISAAIGHACAVVQDGSAWCWGCGGGQRLGFETENFGQCALTRPVNLKQTGRVSALAGGHNFGCVLMASGKVDCWGTSSTAGAIGAAQFGPGRTAVQIAGRVHHACVVLNDATVKCWGGNSFGQLGIGRSGHVLTSQELSEAPTALVP